MGVQRVVMGDADELERQSTEADRARREAREGANTIVPFTYKGHNFQYRSDDNTILRVADPLSVHGEVEPDDIAAQELRVNQLGNNVHGHSVFQVRLGPNIHFQVTIDTHNGGVQEIKSMTTILTEKGRPQQPADTPDGVQSWLIKAISWLRKS